MFQNLENLDKKINMTTSVTSNETLEECEVPFYQDKKILELSNKLSNLERNFTLDASIKAEKIDKLQERMKNSDNDFGSKSYKKVFKNVHEIVMNNDKKLSQLERQILENPLKDAIVVEENCKVSGFPRQALKRIRWPVLTSNHFRQTLSPNIWTYVMTKTLTIKPSRNYKFSILNPLFPKYGQKNEYKAIIGTFEKGSTNHLHYDVCGCASFTQPIWMTEIINCTNKILEIRNGIELARLILFPHVEDCYYVE